MDSKEILAPYDDETLITCAAMRMLDVLGEDSTSLLLMTELCERRGSDPYSFEKANVQVAAEVQLDILARFGKVIGQIADGNFTELPDLPL